MNHNYSSNHQIILVIKDVQQDLSQLLNLLQLTSYTLVVVPNQQDYLALIESTHPSLIVIDILMSAVDGWSICQQLKNNSHTAHIPLVLLNASGDTALRVGQTHWHNVDCIAQSSESSQIVYLIERRLAANSTVVPQDNTEEDSWSELENLVTSITQDFKSPLDSLSRFAGKLNDEYHNHLDHQAQEYLEQIFDTTSRIQTRIQDLQAYSDAGKGEQTWILVNLNQTWQQIMRQLEVEIAETQAEIVVGELPQIIINPTEISRVLRHLLENALKFTSERVPRITIEAIPKAEEWLITIADNGIGIAPEFQPQIFQAFYRIDSSPESGGSGMGLAICQKIIERYAGTIGVESILGKGSVFYFTLPMDLCPQPLARQST